MSVNIYSCTISNLVAARKLEGSYQEKQEKIKRHWSTEIVSMLI